MVEQYRRLHIHSKDSLKHVVLLKMHVLTVVKSTILYVLTQGLHWRRIYIKKHLETELHTVICSLFRLCLSWGRWPPTLMVHSNVPRAPRPGTRGKASLVKSRMPPPPPSPRERIRNQNKNLDQHYNWVSYSFSSYDFLREDKDTWFLRPFNSQVAVPGNYFFFQKNVRKLPMYY